MGLLSKLFGSPPVKAETLGILDLTQGAAAASIEQDRSALAPLFERVALSTTAPPACNFLLVYCAIAADGRIDGYPDSLREMMRDAGAPFALVATPNGPDSYRAAAPDRPYGQGNLIMTLDRKGDCFPRFFARLIAAMKNGQPFAVAWNALAAQHPGAEHADAPMTIADCALPQLRLE